MARYMEMIFIDSENNARKTGVGAEFATDKATTEAFESVRYLDVGIEDADFILDLHEEDGELVDSIAVDAAGFAEITGELVLSEAEYITYDEKFWEDVRAA